MNTLNIIADINTYLKTENKSILTDLLSTLETEYRHEEAKKQGGNSALKRQKIIEGILKKNKKEKVREQLFKCWKEEINGEEMQICSTNYYVMALNDKHNVNVDMEYEKISFKTAILFDMTRHELKKTYIDLIEIKQELAKFKAEQKQKPSAQRETRCILPIGNSCYNIEGIINILEVFGADAEFYQNETITGASFFKSEVGLALILPCKF